MDDERVISESLSKILRVDNDEVVLAQNGQGSIEQHAAEGIDLLLLDYRQPGLPLLTGGFPRATWQREISDIAVSTCCRLAHGALDARRRNFFVCKFAMFKLRAGFGIPC